MRHQAATDDEHSRLLVEQGIPEHFAHAWSASGIARRNGWYDLTTHTVERLTGRPATSLTDYFAIHRTELTAALWSGYGSPPPGGRPRGVPTPARELHPRERAAAAPGHARPGG